MTTSQISGISIDNNPTPEKLAELGVFSWPIWSKEVSEFPWTYDSSETCYFLEGEVTVTPENATSVTVGKGDLVTFPAGMSCTWKVTKAVKKHYNFS